MTNVLNLQTKTIKPDSVEAPTSYEPIPRQEISDTFWNRLTKWWKTLNKTHELDLDLEALDREGEDYIGSIDDIGEDFITTFLQPDYGTGAGGFNLTLGDLAATLENEHAVQFTINPSKVEAIGKDGKVGLFKTNAFLMPIEITYIKTNNQMTLDEVIEVCSTSGHIGGGRHRMVFWLTVMQFIDGWEDLEIGVIPRGFDNIELQSLYILASNGSRTMTPTEKTVVEASAAQVDVDDLDSLFEAAEKESKMWSKAAQLVAVNLWSEYMADTELAEAKLNTMGKFGGSILTQAKKAIKFYQMDGAVDEAGKALPNEDTAPLVKLLRRREVFEGFMEGALGTFADNFDSLKPLARSESGGHNYSRFMSKIAAAIVEVLVDDTLIGQLERIAEAEAKQKAAEKKKREAKKVQSARDKQLKVAKQAKEIGLDKLKAMMAELEAQEAEAEEAEAEAEDEPEEEYETVVVDDEDDYDEDEDENEVFEAPPAAKRRVKRNR